MWLCVGSASIGLLVGTLVGMSSDHLAKVALGLIFGLLGSSVIAFYRRFGWKIERSQAECSLQYLADPWLVSIREFSCQNISC